MTVYELRKRLADIPNQETEVYVSRCEMTGNPEFRVAGIMGKKDKTLILFDGQPR